MKSTLRPMVIGLTPWLMLGAVLMPGLATATIGVIALSLWHDEGGLALRILSVAFAVLSLMGAGVALILLHRQNRLTRLQVDFIANVSHELRTPLTSIRMYVDTLRMNRVTGPEETAEFLAAIGSETERLTSLVEHLLSSKVREDKRRSAAIEPLDAADTLRTALDPLIHGPEADRVSVSCPLTTRPRVLADRDALVEAIRNLVHNALTHGGPGAVEVEMLVCGEFVRFCVRDHGKGVPIGDQSRIFRRFERGSDSTHSRIPGLGLGLAQVKEFALQCQGDVSIECPPEGGSVFTLQLPVWGQTHE